MASPTPNITLKLLVNKRTQKVLFAEVTKEFVDFLFHILSLPLGSLIEFVGSNQMLGGLGKLKESVELFSQESYLLPDIDKDDIFNRKPAFNRNIVPLLNDAFARDKPVTSKPLYRCTYHFNGNNYNVGYCDFKYLSEEWCPRCPKCNRSMISVHSDNVMAKKFMRGYVKEKVTYMVMDNLEVKPMSSTTLISSFGCIDFSQLEEKTLLFGKNEALKLVKESLVTDQVITTLYRHTSNA